MSLEEQAKDIKKRLRTDMVSTLRRNGVGGLGTVNAELFREVVTELVDDALHQIEPLLIEVYQQRDADHILSRPK